MQVQQLQQTKACDVVRQQRHMALDLHMYTDANLQDSRLWFCLACVRRMHAHHEHEGRSGSQASFASFQNMQTSMLQAFSGALHQVQASQVR
jgi:hypothetical protein